MKDSHYRISLDIHSTQSQVSLPVKQGDTSRKVFISLCEGGKPYHIEDDCFAVFSAKKPDGKVIEDKCIIADNVIEYSIKEQTSSARGIHNCEIKLYSTNYGLITSPSFTIIVDGRAVSDEEIESTSEYSALTELYTETAALKNEVETKLANGEFDGEDVDYSLVANALKNHASGSSIVLSDVSPAEHTMNVKLSSDTADVSKANVVVCGKNLALAKDVYKGATAYLETTIDDRNCVRFTSGNATKNEPIKFAPNTQYTVSFYARSENFNAATTPNCGFAFFYEDGDTSMVTVGMSAGWGLYKLTSDAGRTITHVGLVSREYRAYVYVDIDTFMLELGSNASKYEPCKESATYTPKADGTVKGVTSIYPTTILTTDTEGVTIDVEYNKDANKVIDELIALIRSLNRITYINLAASKWQGSSSPYSQVVSIPGATANSFIEFCFSTEQLEIFRTKDISFIVKNNNGVITVDCVGQKPTADYKVQVKITEVQINE